MKVKRAVGSSGTCLDLENIQKKRINKGRFSPVIDEKQGLEQKKALNRRLQMDPG